MLAGVCVLVAIPFYESDILIFLNDNLGRFERVIEQHRGLALAGYMAIYVGSVAVSFPGAVLLTLIGGFGFGALVGGMAAATSATLGGLCAFLAARALSRDWSRKLAGLDLAGVIEALEQDAASYLIFLRLMPVFPFWLVNLAAAVAGVRLTTFAWTTFFGVMPGGFAFAAAGEALGAILERQSQAYRACIDSGTQYCGMHLDRAALVDRRLLLALGLLGALALIPVAIKRIPPLRRFCESKGWIKPRDRS
ncbi:MAG: TVP38/TMEM64 family protein [Hyphomicrobiales bacterium]